MNPPQVISTPQTHPDTANNQTAADRLPAEIYQCILESLPDQRSERVQTLLTCRLACSHLKAIVELSLLWADEYNLRWAFHDPAREAERTAQFDKQWFKRYLARSQSDYEVLRLVEKMASQRKGRHLLAQRIYRVYGKDAWDILDKYANMDPPDDFDANSQWLSVSFWAAEMHRAMHRAVALERIFRMRAGQPMELEEGLSTLDSFFGVAYEKIKRGFDLMAQRCRETLLPGTENDTRAMCLAICDWMRSQGFGPAEGERYLAIQNHFLHKVLESKTSLPLTLVAIFVSIARRLGLDAHAVPFPAHVHAWVAVREHVPQAGEEQQHLSIDVYNSATNPILTQADFDPIFHALGTTAQRHPDVLAPSPTPLMVLRAARNVANSLRQGGRNADTESDSPWRYWTVVIACYAMVTTISFLSDTHQDDHLADMATHVNLRIRHIFPLDIAVVVELAMLPNLGHQTEGPIQMFRSIVELAKKAEDAPLKPATRRTAGSNVKYSVGLVVALTRYGVTYIGVITGWNIDGSYKTADGVTSSPADPIYRITYTSTASAIAQDTQTRYELQGNVRPFSVADFAPDGTYYPHCPPMIQGWGLYLIVRSIVWDLGRVFRNVVNGKSGHLWFIPTDDLALEYPDDSDAGRAFIEEMEAAVVRYD